MTKAELSKCVKEFKREMNGDCRACRNYPESLTADEKSILHWCSTECLDVSEHGLHCPVTECPLHSALYTILGFKE